MKKLYATLSFHIYEMKTQDVVTASNTGTFDADQGDTIVEWNGKIEGEMK